MLTLPCAVVDELGSMSEPELAIVIDGLGLPAKNLQTAATLALTVTVTESATAGVTVAIAEIPAATAANRIRARFFSNAFMGVTSVSTVLVVCGGRTLRM
jgi:hypothetical protein